MVLLYKTLTDQGVRPHTVQRESRERFLDGRTTRNRTEINENSKMPIFKCFVFQYIFGF